MSARNRLPRQPEDFRGFRDGPRPVFYRGAEPFPFNPAVLEDKIETQRREIQGIIVENRQVDDENMMFQRDLVAAKDEILRLRDAIPKLHADGEAHHRELIARGLKLEPELRNAEALRREVTQLRDEAQKLNAMRQDLSSQVQTLTKDVAKLKTENQQVTTLKADFDRLQKELSEARRAFDYEKKANEVQVEQKQAMERNLVTIAREVEKLRAQHMSGEIRSHGLGAGGYDMLHGSPEMRYPGVPYGDIYGGGAWAPYDKRGPPRH